MSTTIDRTALSRQDRNRATTAPRLEPPPVAPAPAPTRRRWLVLAGLVTAALLEVMDVSIVNVALPQMSGNLGTTITQIAWVATGYTLANAVVLPMTAWLAHRFGRKRYLLVSVAVFTAGSLLCGFSSSLTEIILWRVLQGAAGAALISTAQATIVEIFPAGEQSLVQSIFGFALLAAPAFAPWLGGWITDNYSWPWVFFINIPIGLAAAAVVGLSLQDPPEHQGDAKAAADWVGIGLLAAGLGCLQFVLEEGQPRDWYEDSTITWLTVIAVAALLALVAWELWPGNKQPIVDLRVYKERSLSTGVLLSFVTGFGLYGVAFLLPQFLQDVLSLTPTASGAALIPEGLATLAAVVVAGLLLERKIDPRLIIGAGLLTAAAGLWDLTHLSPLSSLADTRLGVALEGAGAGFLIIPVSVAAFGDLKGMQIGQGAAQLGLGRQLGGAFGIAILTTTVVQMTARHRAEMVTHLFSGSLQLSERLAGTVQALTARGYSSASAPQAALHLLDISVQGQASALAYLDAFRLLCLAYLVSLPLLLLLKRGNPIKRSDPKAGSVPAGH